MLGYLLFGDRDKVDFNEDIRPILNQKCMSCHGGVRQQGGLSFLTRETALTELESGVFAIAPNSVSKSVLIDRIEHQDPEVRMPPTGEPLNAQEIKVFKKWIEEGAEWSEHWSFLPPDTNLQPPELESSWIRNEVDAFVLNRLEQEKVSQAVDADPATLVRRVSLDLIGLPPDPGLAADYLADPNDETYTKFVDSLLASPHFGERWAALWLDLARYADSQGYQKDPLRRTMWAYRDWVIHALNQDMPFDQFTIEQLAGDLLPDPTDGQLLATAFHRNTMSNDEGGTDDEEFRVVAVIDRVNTSFEVWQGVTMSCVQCHSHPYDPIQHEEYYQAYAIFNQTADHDHPKDLPKQSVFSPAQLDIRTALTNKMEALSNRGDTLSPTYQEALSSFLSIQPSNVPVLQTLADSTRDTRLFERGNWLAHGKEVKPGVPQAIDAHQKTPISNRLDFAKWLVDEKNPLTGRVMVNRLWEQIFGIGLIESLEDFGTQGYEASHPELLDWLAVQFSQDLNWSIKQILRTIVLSSTYQQSSSITDELLARDPYNRLLARGPRLRLSAEQIRDQALVVSGLFNAKVYGPSVMPYQPEGVWNTIRHVGSWHDPEDENDKYRRGLYTFWRRVSPYPSMIAFDTPSRELCVSRRIRTNTPIQALITMNDPVYVEAAQALANLMAESSTDLDTRIAVGFRRIFYTDPTALELETLTTLYHETIKKYRNNALDPDLQRLQGEPHDAALALVASVMLNLDEAIMKS